MSLFNLKSEYSPAGDQPEAIKSLLCGLKDNERHQVLLGVTGSGKTFTLANVIAQCSRPVLVISHNKTLAAQLYSEFRQFFPDNAVSYFVSYYDYYQPEAYIPHTDTYIEKDSSINDALDRLRLAATSSLMERRDVIIVASVSCIYGLGDPEDYRFMMREFSEGDSVSRDLLVKKIVEIQYERNNIDFSRGKIRVRGEIVEIFPSYMETYLRLEFDGDRIRSIYEINAVTGEKLKGKKKVVIYPAKHFVTPKPKLEKAFGSIKAELEERYQQLKASAGGTGLLYAERLKSRTEYDLEMLLELGICKGIENYSRHLSGRAPGSAAACLIDYFPKDFLTVIDESHVTLPQIRGMYSGDKSRKDSLVEYGFRLPSAYDNRPLKFDEFEKRIGQVIYVSATPGDFELEKSKGVITEQIVRPTGLIDPEVLVLKKEGQIERLMKEIEDRAQKKERSLVTTLTKKQAEELSRYLSERKFKVMYLHSELDAFERVKVLSGLRKGDYDCIVGVNLLREGLDLPEVSLVAILDADTEGFLRSTRSLIQLSGRAARHINGRIIMFADRITETMEKAISEMSRRREKQAEYNRKHKITPKSIVKALREEDEITGIIKEQAMTLVKEKYYSGEAADRGKIISQLEKEMLEAADSLNFELAILLRDRIEELKQTH